MQGAEHEGFEVTAAARLKTFMAAAAADIGGDPLAISQEISGALSRVYPGAPDLAPAETPACDLLPELLSNGQSLLMKLLMDCAQDLHWRQPGFGTLPQHFAQKLAVAELIGPNGLFLAADVRIGVLIQRQRFCYPMHRHAAEELYYVLQGAAKWTVADELPVTRPPGSFIHHKSFQPHGIETTDTPLCALWGWIGNIDGGSYSF